MRNIKAFFLLACMLGSVVFVNAQNKATGNEVREQQIRERKASVAATTVKPVVQTNADAETRAAERAKNKTTVKSTRQTSSVSSTATKPNASTAPVPSTAVQIQRAKQAEVRKTVTTAPQKGSN